MATPTKLQRLVRRKLVQMAKADTALLALVPSAHIDPKGEPVWPFVLFETPRTNRFKQSCVRGAIVRFDIHAFVGPRMSGRQEVETGYDHASRVGESLETVFADNRITLEGGAICKIEFSDTQLLKDRSPDEWHWFGQMNCRVLSAPA
jgi:hypothetical protein